VRGLSVLFVLVLAARSSGATGVEVRLSSGRVDLKLPGASLSEVLDRLASELGFKLVREDGAPNPFIPALEFKHRTPLETVLGVLEGQGLNYAITMDDSGVGVESLVLTSVKATAAATAPSRSPLSERRSGAPPSLRMPPPNFDEPEDDGPSEPPEMTPSDIEEPPALPGPPPSMTPPPHVGPRAVPMPSPANMP
jgi:hypothetical protein